MLLTLPKELIYLVSDSLGYLDTLAMLTICAQLRTLGLQEEFWYRKIPDKYEVECRNCRELYKRSLQAGKIDLYSGWIGTPLPVFIKNRDDVVRVSITDDNNFLCSVTFTGECWLIPYDNIMKPVLLEKNARDALVTADRFKIYIAMLVETKVTLLILSSVDFVELSRYTWNTAVEELIHLEPLIAPDILEVYILCKSTTGELVKICRDVVVLFRDVRSCFALPEESSDSYKIYITDSNRDSWIVAGHNSEFSCSPLDKRNMEKVVPRMWKGLIYLAHSTIDQGPPDIVLTVDEVKDVTAEISSSQPIMLMNNGNLVRYPDKVLAKEVVWMRSTFPSDPIVYIRK